MPRLFGYDIREPSKDELGWFSKNPKVSGRAVFEDNTIVLNPYSGLTPEQYQAVAVNEAARLYMRNNNIVPEFDVTDEQVELFKGTAYEKDPLAMRETILGRGLSSDPSSGKLTPQQKALVEILRKAMMGGTQ